MPAALVRRGLNWSCRPHCPALAATQLRIEDRTGAAAPQRCSVDETGFLVACVADTHNDGAERVSACNLRFAQVLHFISPAGASLIAPRSSGATQRTTEKEPIMFRLTYTIFRWGIAALIYAVVTHV